MYFDAAVLTEAGEPLAIERVELTGLGSKDVLIRVGAAGLCHTDWEVQQGMLPAPTPIVLGHEAAGVVEDVGSEVTSVQSGDKVVCSVYPGCGHCYYCRRGQPMLCEVVLASHKAGTLLDGNTRLRLSGRPLHHFMTVGGFGEYAVVPEHGAIPVPDAMPVDRACILGCAVITGVGAVSRIAKVELGSRVAVIGCGPIGLNAVQGAARVGAGQITAVDMLETRLDFARKLGATHIVNAADVDPVETVRELTGGRGADFVFEAGGSEKTLQVGLEATRPGGTMVILGKVEAHRYIEMRFGSLMGEKRIIRSSLGGACAHDDFPAYANAYLSGELEIDSLVTRRMSLDQINDGLDSLSKGELIRGVVVFDGNK